MHVTMEDLLESYVEAPLTKFQTVNPREWDSVGDSIHDSVLDWILAGKDVERVKMRIWYKDPIRSYAHYGPNAFHSIVVG